MDKTTIVVDIGGTNIRAGFAGSDSKPILIAKTPINRVEIIPSIILNIKELIKAVKSDTFQIVIGCPGLISLAGEISAALYWPAAELKLKEDLSNEFNCAVEIVNDANLQALGLIKTKKRHALYVTIGTGVGGSILLGDRLHIGKLGYAGEFGHMKASGVSEDCLCGNSGCLDTVASGYWLEKKLGKNWWKKHINDDAKVIYALKDAGTAVAHVTKNLITALDIREVILAGHIVVFESFQKSFQDTLKNVKGDLSLDYIEDTWPLVSAGAQYFVDKQGELF